MLRNVVAGVVEQSARTGDAEDLKLLLRRKRVRRSVDCLNGQGMGALHLAARYNHLQAVRVLVEKGKAG